MSNNLPLISKLTNHILSSGGKRIRPILTLACSKLCNYSGDRHIKMASIIEFIHTATLLHDDVVDNSKKRRGKTTANFVWDNVSPTGQYYFRYSCGVLLLDPQPGIWMAQYYSVS